MEAPLFVKDHADIVSRSKQDGSSLVLVTFWIRGDKRRYEANNNHCVSREIALDQIQGDFPEEVTFELRLEIKWVMGVGDWHFQQRRHLWEVPGMYEN